MVLEKPVNKRSNGSSGRYNPPRRSTNPCADDGAGNRSNGAADGTSSTAPYAYGDRIYIRHGTNAPGDRA